MGERESQTETAASVRAALDSLGQCDASMLLHRVQVRGWLADAGINDRALLVAFGELASEGLLHAWWNGLGAPMEDATRTISALGMDSAVPRALLAQVLAPAHPQIRTVSSAPADHGLRSHRDILIQQPAAWGARPPLGAWGAPPHRPPPSGVAGNVEGVPSAAGGSGARARSERDVAASDMTDEHVRTLLEHVSALPASPSPLGAPPRRMITQSNTSGGTRSAGGKVVPPAFYISGAPPVGRGALSGPAQAVATGGARIQAARGVVLFLVAICGGDWTASSAFSLQCPKGFVRIEAGSFTMGSPTGEENRYSDEHQHSVTITRAFCMETTEVTQAQWKALSGGINPSYFQNTSCTFGGCASNENANDSGPVEQIDWYAAVAFANARSAAEGLTSCYTLSDCADAANGWQDGIHSGCTDATFAGRGCTGYRLPTEAEWEYAARAGTTDPTYGLIESVGWYSGNSGGSTKPVGGKTANSFGLSDMLGNVWEWTGDWYDYTYPGNVTDPLGAGAGFRRVAMARWAFAIAPSAFASRGPLSRRRSTSLIGGGTSLPVR